MEPDEEEDRRKEVTFRFRSRLEQEAFAAGVEWVNDSALALIGSGAMAFDPEYPDYPWTLVYCDDDAPFEDSYTMPVGA